MTDPQLLLFADVVPNGNGGFVVQPRKPLGPEITTKQAARILGVCRAQMWYLRNCHPQAQKILKWRFTSEKAGKILWDAASVQRYRELTLQIDS
jgi:hypothetical protein